MGCTFLISKSLRNAQRNSHALRSRNLGHRHRRRTDDAADHAAHLSARDSSRNAAHYAARRHFRRRRFLFLNHLHFLRNLGRGAQLAVDQVALNLFHHSNRGRCRRGWRWRGWRRGHQESHQLLLGQRFGEYQRQQDQDAYQQRLQNERDRGRRSPFRFQPCRRTR